jgi:2'-hydroxyisoflavone reductase
MKILVLGGTGFYGPHLVRALVANQHQVTLFNRGKRDPTLFPDLETLIGDRDPDKDNGIKPLQGRNFDVAIDSSGHYPRHVKASAELLAKNELRQYVFISSIGVHPMELFNKPGLDETAPVTKLDDPTVETMGENSANYGGLKALCERAVEAAMPGKTLVIRPGLISGPGDWSDRFGYWPVRIDRGGEVLVPNCPESPVQYIDVRDLAEWTVRLVEQPRFGIFNATGPAHPLTWIALLYGCKAATTSDAHFTWVDERWLEAQGVAPWQEIPLWVPTYGQNWAFLMVSIRKALDAGLTFRPVAVTAMDTIAWAKNERPKDRPPRAGLNPDKETTVLKAWHEKRGDAPTTERAPASAPAR